MKTTTYKQQGFTIIELLIAIGIVGVLAAMALPAYQGYIAHSCATAAEGNLQTLLSAQKQHRLDYGTYVAGTHLEGATSSALTTTLDDWKPNDKGKFEYVVGAGSGTITSTIDITVSSSDCAETATYTE